MVLRGQNAERVRFGTINIRTGRRLWLVRNRQRTLAFGAFLELIHRHYRAWHVVVLRDEDSSHTARVSRSLAHTHKIRLERRPKRNPQLKPVDHLWHDAKRVALANRQHRSIGALVRHLLAYLNRLTSREALRKAGLLSPDFQLRDKL